MKAIAALSIAAGISPTFLWLGIGDLSSYFKLCLFVPDTITVIQLVSDSITPIWYKTKTTFTLD
jgi:hypothetical protein